MSLKPYIVLVRILFISSLFYGFFTPPRNGNELKMFEIFKVVIEHDESLLSFAIVIFINNIRTSMISILLGPTLIVPAAITIFNGVLIGQSIAIFTAENKSITDALLLIIPHGVIELTAFTLSNSLGLMLGTLAFKKYIFKKKDISLLHEFSKIIAYVKLIIILLIIAAFIEAYITLTLAYMFNLVS